MSYLRLKSNSIFMVFIVFFFTLILTIPSMTAVNNINLDYYFLFTNFCIGLISFLALIFEAQKRTFSLKLMHWLFHYMFFFIAPLVQYLNNSFSWSLLQSSDTKYLLIANTFILLWQLLWIISGVIFESSLSKKKMLKRTNNTTITFSARQLILLCFLSVITFIILTYLYGFSGLFTRGSSMVNSLDSSSVKLVVNIFFRSIPVAFLAATIVTIKNNRFNILYSGLLFIAIILTLLTSFPTGVPRFWAAGVYLGLIFLTLNIGKNSVIYLIFGGLTIIFPLLDAARRVSTLSEINNSISYERLFSGNLILPDYDAFSMIVYTTMYIEGQGSTLGNQLLTSVLFFIPRSIWSEKSIGSGAVVADAIRLPFNNVSNSLLAEGLINFSVLGLIIFATFFSMVCSKLDDLYWIRDSRKIKLIYPFWMGFFFFMMRGDMLSTFSYIVGFTLIFLIISPKSQSDVYSNLIKD